MKRRDGSRPSPRREPTAGSGGFHGVLVQLGDASHLPLASIYVATAKELAELALDCERDSWPMLTYLDGEELTATEVAERFRWALPRRFWLKVKPRGRRSRSS